MVMQIDRHGPATQRGFSVSNSCNATILSSQRDAGLVLVYQQHKRDTGATSSAGGTILRPKIKPYWLS